MISSLSPSYNNIQYYFNFLLISLFHWTAWSDYQYQWTQDKLCHQHVSLNSASVVGFFSSSVSVVCFFQLCLCCLFFFQLCLCCPQKLMFFFLLTSTSGWFYPFSRGHSLQKMHLLSSTSVFLLLILPTSLLSGDE